MSDKGSVHSNESLVRHRFAELDKHRFEVLDELFDPKYELNIPGFKRPLDLETTKRFYKHLYAAFPDLKHDIEEQICAGNLVVTRWTARGTHEGEWMGVAATGTAIVLTGINIYTVRDGKLSKSHVNWDLLGLAQQLGDVKLRLNV